MIEGMKESYFGENGIIADKLLWYKQALKKRRKLSIGIESRIDIGPLSYL